ncbi:MAG: BMP family ABC transporter substrate-binding protein, partial [Oscillospiraceae bacterium]|nr:BMP family ABC transporter substrate-binding protein [Oscillospiraceae bacterium]
MKKIIALLLALVMVVGLVACAAPATEAPAVEEEAPVVDEAPVEEAPAEEGKVYNVAYLVNGNLGDKSFFDSAEAGLASLKEEGRIEYVTIEMGGLEEDQPTWLSTLYDVSESGEYDLIVCGTYQMPDY